MTLVVTLAEPVLLERVASRDRRAAEAAAAQYERAFRRMDGDLRALRAEGWPAEDLAPVQAHAEMAWRAARAERQLLEEEPTR